MRKFLLMCFTVTLLYGNYSFGMDRDEVDRKSTADHSSQDWTFKSEKNETRSERQKRQLQQLNAELKRNQLATDSKNPEEKREVTPKEDLSEKSNFPPNKQQSDLINLQREKIAKYESALQKLTQELKEEREKKIKIEKLMKLLDDVKSKIKTNKIVEKNLASDSKRTSNSEQKEFKFKNFDTQHPETLFNIGSSTESKRLAQPKRRIHKKATEYQPNFVLVENKTTPKQPQDQLIEAIKKGNLADVSNAIKNGAIVKTTNALIVACWSGNLEIIRYLLKHGADVNGSDRNGTTPLMIAAQEEHANVVKFLVEHGADINKATNDGVTPLYLTSQNGYLEIVKFLVEHGADINKTYKYGGTPLHAAARGKKRSIQNGRFEIVKYLVEHGADINKATNDGVTPLHVASHKGHLEIVKFLIEHGADTNKASNDGVTPLYLTSQNGYLEIVKFLVEHGADINKATNNGGTPLHAAAQNGRFEIVKYLVEHGADINKTDKYGWTPLHDASHKGHLDIVQFLIEHDADIQAKNLGVHLAVRSGYLDVVKYLVEHDANIMIGTPYNLTPLSIAKIIQDLPILTDDQRKKYQEVIDYLKSKAAEKANATSTEKIPYNANENSIEDSQKSSDGFNFSNQKSIKKTLKRIQTPLKTDNNMNPQRSGGVS